MISDILSDASAEISRYMQEMPEVYSDYDICCRIKACQREMDALRQLLDTPPIHCHGARRTPCER